MNATADMSPAEEIALAIEAAIREPVLPASRSAPATVTVCAPRFRVLAQVDECPECPSYADGRKRGPRDGFCPRCGVLIESVRKKGKHRRRQRFPLGVF